MKSKYIIWAIIVLALISTGVYIGLTGQKTGAASPTGATYDNGLFSGVVMNPSTGNATTTGILNTSSNARYITGTKIACTGVGTSLTAYTGTGLSALTVTIATSTVQTPATLVPVIAVGTITVATSTFSSLEASTTLLTATTSNAILWPSGVYENFAFNATNTAVCTVGVDYIGS